MADILDAAQKSINDAAQTAPPAGTPPAPPVPPSQPSPPLPPLNPLEEKQPSSPPTEEESKLVDSLIQATEENKPKNNPPSQLEHDPSSSTPAPNSTIPPVPVPKPDVPHATNPTPPNLKKKGPRVGIILAALLLALFLPVGLYFMSYQSKLRDLRSKAANPGDCACVNGWGTCWEEVGGNYDWRSQGPCGRGCEGNSVCGGGGGGSQVFPPPGGGGGTAPPSEPAPTQPPSGRACSGSSTCSGLAAGTCNAGYRCVDCACGSGSNAYACWQSDASCTAGGGGTTVAPTQPPSGGGGTGATSGTAPAGTGGGVGECTAGPTHEYNECCGGGLSRHVTRECRDSKYYWNWSACNQPDGACGAATETPISCSGGEVFYNGKCYPIGGCTPSCSGKSCGANDGCSGVCTESCSTQEEATVVSNRGVQPDPNGGIVNSGTPDPSCNNTTGICQAGAGQTAIVCNCDTLQSSGALSGICQSNCVEVSGPQNCQALADEKCQVIQLDIIPTGDPNTIIDTIVCTPNATKCGTTQTTGTGGGGGGGETTTTTTTPPPGTTLQCSRIRVYKGTTQLDAAGLAGLHQGDVVTLAVAGAGATQGRIRVNGGTWNTTTTKNTNDEFTVSFTISANVTSFTVEAEVFGNGVWK